MNKRIEKLQEIISKSKKEIEEIQNKCPHEKTEEGLYEFRPGQTLKYEICVECGKPIKPIKDTNEIITSEPINTFQYEIKQTKIISAFPGTGKSFYYKNNIDCLDSDSSKFDKEYFPSNYIKHIKDNIGKVNTILVSSHEEVRTELVKEKINFILVYPNIKLKEEYLKRYKERKSPKGLIKIIETNWEDWIIQLQNQKNCIHIILESGQYLSDVIN